MDDDESFVIYFRQFFVISEKVNSSPDTDTLSAIQLSLLLLPMDLINF